MFKRTTVLLLVAAFFVGMAGVACAAEADYFRTNATQKASLLFYPRIDTSYRFDNVNALDTFIMLANDDYRQVWVKCYWMNSKQDIQDFMFPLTPNQPVYFRASNGQGTGDGLDSGFVDNPVTVPPFFGGYGEVGELKCWAVNAAGTAAISHNHLYGSAIIVDYDTGDAWEYNAWGFAARGVARGSKVKTDDIGSLILSGELGYFDACPKYILANFFTAGAQIGYFDDFRPAAEDLTALGPQLTVTPCIQDLRQDRTPTCSKIKFDIWNSNEVKYTGAYACYKCWFEDFLGGGWYPAVGGSAGGYRYGYGKFTWAELHTNNARFRAQSIYSTVCIGYSYEGQSCSTIVPTPIVGVMAQRIAQDYDPEFPELSTFYTFGTNVHTAGKDGTGIVKWDVGEAPVEAPAN